MGLESHFYIPLDLAYRTSLELLYKLWILITAQHNNFNVIGLVLRGEVLRGITGI